MAPGSRGRAIVLAAALALLVFEIVPGSLYVGNVAEFAAAPGPLAGLLLAPAALLLACFIVVLRLSRRQDFSRACAVLAAAILLVWAQSYLLVWQYGPLDGTPIDWTAHRWRGWVDLPLWLAVLGAAAVFHGRLERPLVTAALAVLALQAALLAGSAIAQRDALKLKSAAASRITDPAPMARFSSTRNVVHIVLDSFQADVFDDIVNGPGGASLQRALRGFTFFQEQLGTFPATYLALPVIVSGRIYRNDVPQARFMESVYGGRNVLNAAHDAGFEVDVATDPWMLDALMKGHVDHAYRPGYLPLEREAARLLDLALFRLAPHWLKPLVYNDQRWLAQRAVTRSELLGFPYFTHSAFLGDVARRFTADRPAPVYKFFHLMTPHTPFVVNPDCSYAGRVLPRVRETVTAQSRCSLVFVVALLEQMKAAGVYDDSLIVLMGDHGGHIPPHRYRPGAVVQGEASYELRPDLVGLATPLLAIKPPGATHPFQTSQALTSMSDVAATIDALAQLHGGLPGASIFDGQRDFRAPRHFYGYYWSKMDPVSEYVQAIQENTVTGSAYQVESWHVDRTFLPPGHP